MGAIDGLYKANGINTDLQMALFLADHDINLDEALRQAGTLYEKQPSVQAADVLAWALYKLGRYEEARDYSLEAMRLGTKDALVLFHAGMISYRMGYYEIARDYLEQAVGINPRFSILHAGMAASTLQDLRSMGRR